jgi:hypothetical protein
MWVTHPSEIRLRSIPLRQASLGEEDEMSSTHRNLSSEPCGWKARPVEPDQRLEASPVRGAGNPHREAWTASPKAMLWSVERPFVGALAVVIPGAALRHRNGLVPAVPPASTGHGERTFGGPQEPGRSCRLLREIPAGRPGQQLRASTAHSSGEERRERVGAEVPPSEGDEVRRDGRQEVIAP